MFLLLKLVEKPTIDLQYVRLDLLVRDLLQTQRLDRVGEETACTLKHSIRIALQIDELSIGEHLQKCLHTTRMRWVLAQVLRAIRVP